MDSIVKFFSGNGSHLDGAVSIDSGATDGTFASAEGIIVDEESDDFLRILRERYGYPHPENHECYNIDTVKIIQVIYILAVVLWIIFVFWAKLYEGADILTWLFILIPPLIYLIGFVNACNITFSAENDVLGANYLSFGFLITIILLNWNTPLQVENKNQFLKLLVVAFVLIMLSMIDVWVSRRNMSIVRHVRTMLQTAALVILSLSLYFYYRHQEYNYNKSKSEEPDGLTGLLAMKPYV